MSILDVFKSDAFSVTTLTDAINKMKYVPGRIGSLGLFTPTGVNTTSIVIDEKNGVLQLVSPSPRGGPGTTLPRATRQARSFRVPHFEINDAVMAEEVQGVRSWGSETEVETVQAKLGERMMEAAQSFAATQEYAQVGAVKGIVTYADGTELNLFDEMGITPPADVYLDLQASSPTPGALRTAITGIARTIGGNLSDIIPFTGLYAICGNNFYDALIQHEEVRASYLSYAAAAQLRDPTVSSPMTQGSWGVFQFGGVAWDNYFGAVGDTDFVDTDQAHVFPLGVPRLFRSYYAPADYVETVNTIGQRLYVKQYEMQNTKGIHLDTQMNSLDICTRPGTLIRCHKGHA
jgi:hypothetical protein